MSPCPSIFDYCPSWSLVGVVSRCFGESLLLVFGIEFVVWVFQEICILGIGV